VDEPAACFLAEAELQRRGFATERQVVRSHQ
jgi:hypothetical protein